VSFVFAVLALFFAALWVENREGMEERDAKSHPNSDSLRCHWLLPVSTSSHNPIHLHLSIIINNVLSPYRIICGLWGHYKGWSFVIVIFELFCVLEALSALY